jgi:hypothetical protein
MTTSRGARGLAMVVLCAGLAAAPAGAAERASVPAWPGGLAHAARVSASWWASGYRRRTG